MAQKKQGTQTKLGTLRQLQSSLYESIADVADELGVTKSLEAVGVYVPASGTAPAISITFGGVSPVDQPAIIFHIENTQSGIVAVTIDGKTRGTNKRIGRGLNLILALWRATNHKLPKAKIPDLIGSRWSDATAQIAKRYGTKIKNRIFAHDSQYVWLTQGVFVENTK